MNLMEEGVTRREVKATDLNADSSRSHSLFTLYVKVWDKEQDVRTESKLNLVDLAGSERQSKTGATGETLKEGNAINLSLTALGTVIDCLVKQKGHIPYRSTHLTMLLKDGLGGNSRTVIVGTIGPSNSNSHETVSTLRFIDRAKQIKNKPKVQMDPKDAKIAELMELVKKLKRQLGIDSGDEGEDGDEGDEGGAEGKVIKRAVLFDDEIEKYKQRIEQLEMEVSSAQEATASAQQLEAQVQAKEAALEAVFAKKEAKLLEEIADMKDRYSLQDSNEAAEQYNELLSVCTEFLLQADTTNEWAATVRRVPQEARKGETIVDGLCSETPPEPGTLLPTTDDIRNGLRSLKVNGVDMRQHALRKHSIHCSPAGSIRGGEPPLESSPVRQPHPPPSVPPTNSSANKFNRGISKDDDQQQPPPAAVGKLQNEDDEDDQFPTKDKRAKREKKDKTDKKEKKTKKDVALAASLPSAAVGLVLEKLGLNAELAAVAKTAIEDLLAQQRTAVFEEQRKRAQKASAAGGDNAEMMAAYEQLQEEVESAQANMNKQRQQLDKARAVADKKIGEVSALKEHIDALREELASKHAQHAAELERQQEQLIHQFNKKTEQMLAKQSKAAKAERKSHASLSRKLEEVNDQLQDVEQKFDCKVMEYENLLRDFEDLKVEMLRKFKESTGTFLGGMTSVFNNDMPSRDSSSRGTNSSSSQMRSLVSTVNATQKFGQGMPKSAPDGLKLPPVSPNNGGSRTASELPFLRR